MEKITTKNELIERLKDLYALENLAKDNYEKDAKFFNNDKIVLEISRIAEQEKEHIILINELIDILGHSQKTF
ncbi:MAG: hypothetical protein ACP5OG_05710 [Candidatus Nanoarchaeia archaeon]